MVDAVAEPVPSATGAAYPVPTTGDVGTVVGPVAIDYPSPQLGVVVDAHNQVVNLRKGGAAGKARVQIGDTLLALDDMLFTQGKDTSKNHVSEKEEDTEMPLPLKRNGNEKKVRSNQVLRRPRTPRQMLLHRHACRRHRTTSNGSMNASFILQGCVQNTPKHGRYGRPSQGSSASLVNTARLVQERADEVRRSWLAQTFGA